MTYRVDIKLFNNRLTGIALAGDYVGVVHRASNVGRKIVRIFEIRLLCF